jgi:hypothetical protein
MENNDNLLISSEDSEKYNYHNSKECYNCGSTERVWYNGLCEKCYYKLSKKYNNSNIEFNSVELSKFGDLINELFSLCILGTNELKEIIDNSKSTSINNFSKFIITSFTYHLFFYSLSLADNYTKSSINFIVDKVFSKAFQKFGIIQNDETLKYISSINQFLENNTLDIIDYRNFNNVLDGFSDLSEQFIYFINGKEKNIDLKTTLLICTHFSNIIKLIDDSNVFNVEKKLSDFPKKTNKKEPKELSMSWFDSYVSIMPLFIILYALSTIDSFFNNSIFSNNSLFILGCLIDIVYCYYQYKTYKDLKNSEPNSVNNLLIILGINFFYKSLLACYHSTYYTTYPFYVLIYGIYYVPTLIYFFKRRNVYK